MRMNPRLAVILILLIVLCAVLVTSGSVGNQLLNLTGASTLTRVAPDGDESFSVRLDLKNLSGRPVQIRRAETFVVSDGGWAWSLGEDISKSHKFFGEGPIFAPSSDTQINNLAYEWSSPVSHFLIGVEAASGSEIESSLFQIPISRQRFQPPNPLPRLTPVYIGLQQPLEALSLTSGQKWLTIVGQIINSTGKPLTLTHWRMELKDVRGVSVLSQDLTSTFQVRNSTDSLNEFMYGFVLPNSFGQGNLTIEAEYTLRGEEQSVSRTEAVRTVAGTILRPPTVGLWNYGNGPGELVFHTHYHFPEQRYAYDMGIFRRVGSRLQSYTGDPKRNQSYFCWNQPIHCMEDGVVKEVYDKAPDNFGNTENLANSPKQNNRVVVEHPNNRFSIYAHVCQGCAMVRAGQHVGAGEVLGRVGNAGFSSEPHLHVAYFTIDPTGRVRALPMQFEDLSLETGSPARGVPQGGKQYRSK